MGTLSEGELHLAEVYRFSNDPVMAGGTVYWDVLRLFREMKNGLSKLESVKPVSIGIDTWGVDFALLDRDGILLGNPVHYRDPRTEGMMERVFEIVPREEIYSQTGIQFLRLNTLFQLYSMRHTNSAQLEAAHRLLTMPDFFNYLFTGRQVGEYTIATTTQMYDPRKKDWCRDIMKQLDLPAEIMPEVVPAGTALGEICGDVAQEIGLEPIPVVAPACHDTGSAVAAVPLEDDCSVWISCGTWSIMGIEMSEPETGEKAFAHNFTNEGGVDDTIRFSKNLTGLWLVQESRKVWADEGKELSFSELTGLAREAKPFTMLLNTEDPAFMLPDNMVHEIIAFAGRSGQKTPETPGEIVRVALEGLAFRTRAILDELKSIIDRPFDRIHMVGGGIQNDLLCQFTADVTGLPVFAGPVEATALGNILMQGRALGIISSQDEARRLIRNSVEIKLYEPVEHEKWENIYERYTDICNKL